MCKGITCPHDGVDLEAADEIERLQSYCSQLIEVLNSLTITGSKEQMDLFFSLIRNSKELKDA
jgi:hypothetical protein